MQKIIRHASEFDRNQFAKRSNGHYVTITVEEVIIAIANLEMTEFTTKDVADALSTHDCRVMERAVRATIRQLKKLKRIRAIPGGQVTRMTSTNKEYTAQTYEIVFAGAPADFETLNRVFCHG